MADATVGSVRITFAPAATGRPSRKKVFRLRVRDAMGAANCACGGPILSKMDVSIFRTPRSIFRIFVLFLVTKFLFLELLPTGPVSRFLGVRDHLLQRLMHS